MKTILSFPELISTKVVIRGYFPFIYLIIVHIIIKLKTVFRSVLLYTKRARAHTHKEKETQRYQF